MQVAQIAASGAAVTSVGYGDAAHFDTAFLVGLADAGRGAFLYAPTEEALEPELLRFVERTKTTRAATIRLTLTERMTGIEILGCCVIAPVYRPMDCPAPMAGGGRVISLPNVRGDVTTDVLVRLVVPPPRFGARAGAVEVLAVEVERLTGGPPAAVASARLSSSFKEAQRLDEDVHRARLAWEGNAFSDALLGSPSLQRTGELLDGLARAADQMGRADVAGDARRQKAALVASGQVSPDELTSSLGRVRVILEET